MIQEKDIESEQKDILLSDNTEESSEMTDRVNRQYTNRCEFYEKDKLYKRLIKTKMCRSVSLGVPCKYPDQCSFAHTIEEINIGECLYGDTCKYVFAQDNIWYNKVDIDNACGYLHPGETRANFLKRVKTDRLYQQCTNSSERSLSRNRFDNRYEISPPRGHQRSRKEISDVSIRNYQSPMILPTISCVNCKNSNTIPFFRKSQTLLNEEKETKILDDSDQTTVCCLDENVHVIIAPSEIASQIVCMAIKDGKKKISVTITD